MNLRTEKLDLNEIDKVVNLFCLVWNEPKELVTEKTRWAFANDFAKVLVLKNSDGDIVAVRGGFKWPLMNGTNSLDCYQFHGTCVHPDYRRMGLFSNLNREFLEVCRSEQVEVIYNVSVKASRLGYEKLGWQYLKGFHRLTKVHSWNWIKKAGHTKLLPPENSSIIIEDKFFTARRAQFKNLIHTNYSQEFLDWRLDNKLENYQVHSSENARIVYKTRFVANRRELVIGEIFMLQPSFAVFRKAMQSLMGLEKPDISYTYIFSSHPFYQYYLQYLYLPNPFNYNLNFGVRPIGKGEQFNVGKWAVSFLDIDTF